MDRIISEIYKAKNPSTHLSFSFSVTCVLKNGPSNGSDVDGVYQFLPEVFIAPADYYQKTLVKRNTVTYPSDGIYGMFSEYTKCDVYMTGDLNGVYLSFQGIGLDTSNIENAIKTKLQEVIGVDGESIENFKARTAHVVMYGG